jgi:CRP/FNR family transcriptional regulator, cyclic AMP receptor protein
MQQARFDLNWLSKFDVPLRRFDAGERIFLEADAADCLYVVLSGKVDVITFGNVLETVGPSGIFGEMALIDGGPRSAAALANEATETAVVDKATFHALVREEPEFALLVMGVLAERIRRIGQPRS